MGELNTQSTPLDGLYEIRNSWVGDARGRISRLFCEQDFAAIRAGLHFTQINLSETTQRGSIRGMHYQTPPAAEAKLIRCLRGSVFDVAVDLRADSATFLQCHAIELSEDNDCAVFIPEGFAHGFQALTSAVQLLYLHTAAWTPAREAGVRHDDPRLAIDWPLPVGMISDKDRRYPLIDEHFRGAQP